MTVRTVQRKRWKYIIQDPNTQVDSITRTKPILMQVDEFNNQLPPAHEKC